MSRISINFIFLNIITAVIASAMAAAPDHTDLEPAKSDVVSSKRLNVYSSRQSDLMQPALDLFTQKTGIEVELLSGKADALIERLAREGKSSPADVLITTDIARLYRAAEKGLLMPMKADSSFDIVPDHLRGPDNLWLGLSMRSRVIAYNPERIDAKNITSYLDLGDARYKNRVCMRSSNNEYNQSLMAALLHHHGETASLKWAQAVVANLVQHPQGNDRGQLDLIASGACDLSVVNSYYMGLWLLNPANQSKKYMPKLLFPEQGEGQPGAHVNISGGGIVASSSQAELAEQLLRFLLSEDGQRIYCQANQEYPIHPEVDPTELTKSFSWPVKFDSVDVQILGKLNGRAVMTFDRAQWR